MTPSPAASSGVSREKHQWDTQIGKAVSLLASCKEAKHLGVDWVPGRFTYSLKDLRMNPRFIYTEKLCSNDHISLAKQAEVLLEKIDNLIKSVTNDSSNNAAWLNDLKATKCLLLGALYRLKIIDSPYDATAFLAKAFEDTNGLTDRSTLECTKKLLITLSASAAQAQVTSGHPKAGWDTMKHAESWATHFSKHDYEKSAILARVCRDCALSALDLACSGDAQAAWNWFQYAMELAKRIETDIKTSVHIQIAQCLACAGFTTTANDIFRSVTTNVISGKTLLDHDQSAHQLARAQALAGFAQATLGKSTEADASFNNAVTLIHKIINKETHDYLLRDVFEMQTSAARAQACSGFTEDAFTRLNAAVINSKNFRLTYHQVAALNNIATTFSYLNHKEHAFRTFAKATAKAKFDMRSETESQAALRAIFQAQALSGDMKSAQIALTLCINAINTGQDGWKRVDGLRSIGEAHARLGDAQKTKEYLDLAFKAAQEMSDDSISKHTIKTLCEAYSWAALVLPDSPLAPKITFQDAITASNLLNAKDTYGKGEILAKNATSQALLALTESLEPDNDASEPETHFQGADTDASMIQSQSMWISTHLNIAKVKAWAGDTQGASEAITKVIEAADTSWMEDYKERIYQDVTKLLSNLGQFKDAMDTIARGEAQGALTKAQQYKRAFMFEWVGEPFLALASKQYLYWPRYSTMSDPIFE